MKLARRLPGWGYVIPMDFLFAMGILFVVIATLAPYVSIATTKARLIESLIGAKSAWPLRFELMERMILTGEGLQTNLIASPTAVLPAQRDDVEAELGAKRTGAKAAERASQNEAEKMAGMDGSREESNKVIDWVKSGLTSARQARSDEPLFDALVVDTGIVIRGAIGGKGRPFYLTYTPSVIAEGPPGSILWLCGNKRPPPGWIRLGHGSTDLPEDFQLAVCRDPAIH